MAKAKKINVIRVRPGQDPEAITIPNTLEALQKEVGGFVEPVSIGHRFVILCNEESRINDDEFCCIAFGRVYYGTILFVGASGAEFADVPISAETARFLTSRMRRRS